jgi:hypothetical protein
MSGVIPPIFASEHHPVSGHDCAVVRVQSKFLRLVAGSSVAICRRGEPLYVAAVHDIRLSSSASSTRH